jgi:hypothetical protein
MLFTLLAGLTAGLLSTLGAGAALVIASLGLTVTALLSL